MKAFRRYWIIIILISSILTKCTTEDHIERKRTLDYIVDRNVFTNFKEEGISLKKAVARDHASMIKNQPLKTPHSAVHSSQEELKKQERLLENRSNNFKSLEQNIDETKRRWIIKLAERQRFVEERKDGLLRFATLKKGDSEDLISSSRLKRSKRSIPKNSEKNANQNVTQENDCTVIRQTHHEGKPLCNIQCNECCKQAHIESINNKTVINTTRIPGIDQEETEGIWNACSDNTLSTPAPTKPHNASSWGCIDDIWMITSCDMNWPDDKTIYKCAKGLSFQTNHITRKESVYQVPVFTSDGLVFRNRYCAQCNNYTTFESYKVTFTCLSPPPAVYTPRKVRDYLFRTCKNPKWVPEEDQSRPSCPKVNLPCSKNFTKRTKEEAAHSRKARHCIACHRIVGISCTSMTTGSVKPNRPSISGPSTGYEFKKKLPMSLAVPFDFLDEPTSLHLIKVTCTEENQVYDPYLERCREGVLSKPRVEPFDTYRLHVFYRNSTGNLTLGAFKSYFRKEFGDEHVRYFNDKVFDNGLQFDLSIQRFSRKPLVSGQNFRSVHDKLIKFLQLNQTITVKVSGSEITIYKITYRILTCTDLQTYTKYEYAFLDGYMPAVYINKSRETLPYHNYFSLNDGDIAVCRIHLDMNNCTGAYVPFNTSEYNMLNNGTVYVQSIGKTFGKDEYTIIKETVWACADFGNTFQRSYPRSNAHSYILSIITMVCMSISIIALVFVLVTYCLFSELRTPPGINLMNLSVSILLAQLLWLVGSRQTDNPVACTAIAVLLHYFFLVSFVWTSIIAFDTWRAFTAKRRHALADKHKRLLQCLRYMTVGWLSVLVYELIFVAIEQSGHFKIYGNSNQCWIANATANLYLTVIPVGLVMISNIMLFSMTVNAIRKTKKQTKLITNNLDNRQHVGIYVRIAVMMGFTWIFAFIAPFGWYVLWYPHVVLNSSQGVYIALAFGLNKRVRKRYVDLFRKRKGGRESNTSTKMSLLGSNKRKSSSNSQTKDIIRTV